MIPRQLIIGVAVMVAAAMGMSLYVWRMRGRVDRSGAMVADTQPVAPPASGPTEPVNLYVAYDDAGALRIRLTQIPLPAGRQERAEELLRALLNVYLDKSSPHPLGPGSEVRDVYMVDPGLAVIDLNNAFADGHRSGVLVEELTVVSLVQTLFTNIPGVSRIKILVAVQNRDTLAGHVDLTNTYDATGVGKLVAELQAAP